MAAVGKYKPFWLSEPKSYPRMRGRRVPKDTGARTEFERLRNRRGDGGGGTDADFQLTRPFQVPGQPPLPLTFPAKPWLRRPATSSPHPVQSHSAQSRLFKGPAVARLRSSPGSRGTTSESLTTAAWIMTNYKGRKCVTPRLSGCVPSSKPGGFHTSVVAALNPLLGVGGWGWRNKITVQHRVFCTLSHFHKRTHLFGIPVLWVRHNYIRLADKHILPTFINYYFLQRKLCVHLIF